jgi:ribose transport system ATP-binding protein
MIGRDERVADLGAKPFDETAVALRLDEVATGFGHAPGVSLELRRGEILGLYGLVGAGRSELAKALLGVGRVTGGRVEVAGRAGHDPGRRRRRSIATGSAMSARTARPRG